MQNMRTQWFCFFLFSCISRTSTSLDSIAPTQSIYDGGTLISREKTFKLGFFCPENSKSRYLGIWYYNITPLTVVWVASREAPLNTAYGVLKLSDQGLLVLVNGTNSTVWSSNMSTTVKKPIAQLLDTGNLVVKDGNSEHYLWQSFDHPCDTLLPGMKLGWNLVKGEEWFLSSWRPADDPGHGDYSFKIDRRGFPQAVLLKGTNISTRFGPWNGLYFSGSSIVSLSEHVKIKFVLNQKEIFVQFQDLNISLPYKFRVAPGKIELDFYRESQTSCWKTDYSQPSTPCENYGTYGANTICNILNNPICTCLDKFHRQVNGSKDCVRNNSLSCNKDGFKKYTGMVLPDTSSSWYNKNMVLQECMDLCLKNCSCTAYANLDIRSGGSGCLLWFHDLVDLRHYPHAKGGQDIYIRYPLIELDISDHNQKNGLSKRTIEAIITGSTVFVMCLILGLAKWLWKKKVEMEGIKIFDQSHHNYKLRKEDPDLPTFDLPVIAEATDNFSDTNKLGEGGFGPVYKGTLINGQDIAVKRLSNNSGQGSKEFKNEVALIAKLQHRNLVKLHGYCIQEEEKMLIYEYMPNKSLDYFISDENRSKLLDWSMRFHIIGGIARGLVYLHQDSRLRIIHRDLKTSNILLDENMNSKISDFGLARTLWGDQIDANTNKIAGTYGYMPPEYAVHGHFSTKSDVFSFGVIILEIVSGKKNRDFSDPEHFLNLLGHAWRLWTEGRPKNLMDAFLGERCSSSEVIRCIHVGLLCVQQRPEDRPDMSAVVLMLNGEKLLPQPKAPGFYNGRDKADLLGKFNSSSNNDVSLTVLEAR